MRKAKTPKPRSRMFTELVPPCVKCGHRWGGMAIKPEADADAWDMGMACAHCGTFVTEPEAPEVPRG